jgi:protein-L-isoaspartate(D-aspartate) O-methyltransferase
MSQELRLSGEETVLEIGTGSGYQAAILSKLCRHVVTVERIPELSQEAQALLRALGLTNIEFHIDDGSLGWPAGAPYDGIIVTAAAPEVPPELYDQLQLGGRLVIPIGAGHPQILQTIIKHEDRPQVIDVCECSFVPLIGEEGFASSDEASR